MAERWATWCADGFGEIAFIYKSSRGVKCLLFCYKEVQGGGIDLDPPGGENAHPLRPRQSRMTHSALILYSLDPFAISVEIREIRARGPRSPTDP